MRQHQNPCNPLIRLIRGSDICIVSTEKQVVNLAHFETPLGVMVACANHQGVCLLEFSDRRMLPTEFKSIEKSLNADIVESTNPFFDLLQQELRDYFDGNLKNFTVPLHLVGTGFQKKVWNELLNIPYGETRSYKQQALALNNLPAIRAVAGANGMNKIAIIVPCHRVIGDNGNLTGYGGGLWRKKRLLELEKQHMQPLAGAVVQRSLFEA